MESDHAYGPENEGHRRLLSRDVLVHRYLSKPLQDFKNGQDNRALVRTEPDADADCLGVDRASAQSLGLGREETVSAASPLRSIRNPHQR